MEQNFHPIPFSVLIVAGGGGTRLGGDTPKQYLKLGNFSVLEQSIRVFLSCPGLNQIRIVCDPKHSHWFHDTVQRFNLPDPSLAGKDRKESVYNGLVSFSDMKSEEIILIHDAARPMVTVNEIESVVKAVDQFGAATLAAPISDTLFRVDKIIDRSNLHAIQTPQGFRYGIIREAHEKLRDQSHFTDDAGLVTALGHPVTLVQGSRRNFKITTSDDLGMAEKIMSTNQPQAMETRTGSGFDVHAFNRDKPGPVILGGVAIPHPHALAGHSDADVGLHALTDALLATIAAGDIGTHFPPSDPQWRGVDSTIFLSHAIKLLNERNALITLIDITFLCEEPKIGPHRDAMKRVISRVAGIRESRISIKATTTEKLGFTGRGEGIAAQALATIQIPRED